MYIDKQTLRDLEIFPSKENNPSLFDFLDNTKTTGGKNCLREMLFHLPESYQDVIKQQMAIRYLSENFESYNLPFTDRQMKWLEAYLSSNIEVVKGNSFYEYVEFCLVDIQAYKYLRNSIPDISDFVNGFYNFFISQKTRLPAIFYKALNDLEFIINDKDFKESIAFYSNKKIPFHKVLKADKILRMTLKDNLTSIIKIYYEADALLSVAKTTCKYHFVFPDIVNDGKCLFEANGLYHPMLNNAVSCNVKTDIHSNFIFLTGPNMSGKTTFLKSVGIAIYMAHLGMGVPATYVHMSYFDRLFTSLDISDNILNGYSFFYSEVKRVKQLAVFLANKERLFCLFDELFRGTNIKDAYEATILIASGLALWNNSSFILSSHLWEVWEKIKHFENIKPVYFESRTSAGKPVFSYRLLPGVSDLRLGLAIIENEKIMELLKQGKNNHV